MYDILVKDANEDLGIVAQLYNQVCGMKDCWQTLINRGIIAGKKAPLKCVATGDSAELRASKNFKD